jgi:starch-binding outer membrane protein, SusD/RagB family
MKKFLSIIKTLAVAIGIYGCSDSFLEVAPQNALNEATLGSPQGLDAALISAYSMLDGWNADWGVGPWGGQQSNWGFGDIMSDDANKGTESTDGVEWETLETFTWSPLEGLFNAKFRSDFEAVSRANAVIKLANSVEGVSEEVKQQAIAEARFLRGYFYLDLYKMFKHVPYYTEEDEFFKKPNVTESGEYIDIIDNIKADLQAAADVLPLTQPQLGRATKGAALAFLGKAQLWNEEYAAAKASFDEVVSSNVYALQDCYRSLWTYAGENGTADGKRESIFAFQASINDGTDDAQNSNFGDRLTYPHAGSPFGCCGFRQPSQAFVNAFRVDANGLPDFDNLYVGKLDASTEPVDPRLDFVVARVGVPVLDWDIPYSLDWVRAPSYGGEFSNKKIMYGKNDPVSKVSWVNTQLSGINIHLLRYADLLLMLAEAEVEAGTLARAVELVNMVRARAGNCAQGPTGTIWVDDINAASITWADYEVGLYASFPDKAYATKAIQWERRLELGMEGHRFFDLRRWGTAKEVMDAYVAYEKQYRAHYTKYQGYVEPKHDLYPLPQSQIDLSAIEGNAQLKQNPGY